MPAITIDRLDRRTIREAPNTLFVFGDNFARKGLGGQAKECRGEPNAVGIPTKRAPSMTEDAFMTDEDFGEWLQKSAGAWMRLAQAMDEGKTVAWPSAGIGTGLAQLEKRAPKIWREMQARIASLGGPAQL